MKLYFDPISTTCRPVTFLLHDQGIAFEEGHVNLFLGEQYGPEYLALHPLGQVPLLDDDGFRLSESNAILKYVAQKLGLSVYPSERQAQARVDEMLAWFSTNFITYHGFFGAYQTMFAPIYNVSRGTRDDLSRLSAGGSKRYLTFLDAKLGKHPFVAGDELSIADYSGLSFVTVAEYTDFDFTPYPNVAAWIERLKARPGYQAAYAGFRGFMMAARAEARQSA
jgi:glutathione S-transferase